MTEPKSVSVFVVTHTNAAVDSVCGVYASLEEAMSVSLTPDNPDMKPVWTRREADVGGRPTWHIHFSNSSHGDGLVATKWTVELSPS